MYLLARAEEMGVSKKNTSLSSGIEGDVMSFGAMREEEGLPTLSI
jgi:hypothetical protein